MSVTVIVLLAGMFAEVCRVKVLRPRRTSGRPRVEAEPGFATSAVRDRWCRLLGLPAISRRARPFPPGKDTTRPAEELA